MNVNEKFPELSPGEKLKMDNDILKAKLSAEFGMSKTESVLDDEIENQWLNYIYNFETMSKDAGSISVYEFINKPEFKTIDKLNKEEISSELDRLFKIMEENGIALDTLCDYDDEVIYKFITEELFREETNNIRIEGMRHCFIYEEFHPNHEFDLKSSVDDFIHALFEKRWDKEFSKFILHEKIKFRNNVYERDTFADNIINFQDAYVDAEIISKEILNTEFDTEKGEAEVKGFISYIANSENHSGDFRIRFIYEYGIWLINGVMFPNFG